MQNLANHPERIDELLDAFATAEYVLPTLDENITIRIGESVPALYRMLGNSPWAVITAHNPDGIHCPARENDAAQRALEKCLRDLHPAVMQKVVNLDPKGLWPDEPAWLFAHDDIFEVDALARRFGQRAVVTGRAGGPAALRVYADLRDANASIMPSVKS